MDEKTKQMIAKIPRREGLAQLVANARRLGKYDSDMERAIAERSAELQPPKTKVRKPRSTVHGTDDDARGPSGNPVWSRNELILALDLYLKLRGESIARGDADVAELSAFLRRTR